MGVTIYMARHAEAANPRGILYGRIPRVDLSATGRQQAVELAAALAELPLEALYHSPLLRARRTAAAIASTHPGVPVFQSRLLLENRHPYEGRAQSEVAKLGDRVYDPEILGPNGETILALVKRLKRFMQQVAARHPDGTLVAVAHADPIAALRADLLGKALVPASLRQESPPPAGVFKLMLDDAGGAQLEWFWKPAAPATQPKESTSGDSTGAAKDEQADQAVPAAALEGVA